MNMHRAAQRGSVFTVLLGGIGLTAALGISVYQLFTGPVSSVVRITQKSLADTQLLSIAKIGIMDASIQAAGGDCDADGFIEPRPWRDTAGNKPANGGLVPLTMGAPVTDPWKSDYGYCVWDVGPLAAQGGCGGATGRLNGADNPAAGDTKTQTVMAVISAGPDRQFQTTCNAYVDATTDVITTSGDDIVLRFTYQEAASATSSLWNLKSGEPNTAEISKDLEVGNDITIDESAGSIQASAVNASGKVIANGGVDLGDETAVTVCDASQKGVVRFNTTLDNLEICLGAAGWKSAGNADPSLYTTTPNLVITPGQKTMDVSGTCGNTTCYGANVSFSVKNYGQQTAGAIGSATLSNTTNFEFVSNTCNGVALAQNQSCLIVVRPKATGNLLYTADLTVPYSTPPSGGNVFSTAILSGTASSFGCLAGRTGGGGKYAACGLTDSLTGSTYDLIVMPGGCNGSTYNPTCAGGSDTFMAPFSGGWCCGTATHDINFYGEENIGARASLYIDQVQKTSGNIFSANNYCQSMTYGGYSDWYLPARYEMRDYIYPSKTAIGGFVNADYQTSRVGWNYDVGIVLMTNGTAGMDSYSINNYVRCARRDNLAPPPALADTNPLNVTFTDKTTTSAGARTSSAVVAISGFLQPVDVTVTSSQGTPKIKIDGGGEVDSGTISLWYQTVQLVMDAPAAPGTSNTMTLTIGSDNYTWKVHYVDPASEAMIFVTPAVYSPLTVSGIGNADTICTNAAVSAGIGGTWTAVLSDDATSAEDRLPWNWAVLKRLDGAVVANGWDDLWDGSLQNPINIDSNMGVRNTCVWTGTKTDGSSYSGQTALNWQSNGDDARFGSSSSTAYSWINTGSTYGGVYSVNAACNLYCVEATPGGTDSTPLPYSFPYTIQVMTNARTLSDPVTISGLGSGVNATVTLTGADGSPAFTKNGGGELASGNTVSNGDVVRLVMTAPATASTNFSMTVQIGAGAAVTWRVWTGDPTGTVTKRVFVTNSTWTGNLGGLAGADMKCQAAADAATLGGTWKAIISGKTEPEWAINRIGYNWSTLKLVDNTTTVVTAGNIWKASTQALLSPILKTEYGATVNSDTHTNTDWDGSVSFTGASDACSSYTSNSDSGTNGIGRSASTGTQWVLGGQMSGNPCSNGHRLFCIEQ